MAHARPTAETAGGGLTPDLAEAQAHGCGRDPHGGQSREAGEGVRRGPPGPRGLGGLGPGAWGRRSRGRLRPHAESPWQAGKPSLSSRFLDDRENAKSDGFRPTSVTELRLTARAGALAAPGSALRGKIRDV